MYAEEFILIPRKTYAPDEKTAPQSQILHNPLINDKSSQLNYIQRFRERNISRDSPASLSPTSPIPLTPSNVVPNLRKRNLSALTNSSGDSDHEAEKNVESYNSQQQTNSKRLEKNNEKNIGKTAEVFRKVMESIQELLEANKLERANIVLKQLCKVESLTLDIDGYVLIQGKPTVVKIESFLSDIQQNTKKLESVFYPQILKELNLDPSLVSNTYAKQILRSLKSEAAKPSTSSSFVSDNPTTEDSKRSKPSSSKTRSTTLKPKQSDERKTQKKEFFPTINDDDDKNYESSKESFATTSTKEWKSCYQ